MTPGHRQWKKSILTGGALCAAWWPFPPFIWNNNTSLALNLFILIWIIPPGLNVTSAIPPFIYSVGPGIQFMLLDPDVFFAPFSVVDTSNYHPPFLFRLICLFFLKMGRRPLCPDGGKKKKKASETDRQPTKRNSSTDKKKASETDRQPTKRNSTDKTKKPTTSPGGGSAHRDQSTGNFTANVMETCINEIKRIEAEAAAKGEKPMSRNKICRSYGLAPGTVSKRMTGKVIGMGPQGGGARRGRIFTAG